MGIWGHRSQPGAGVDQKPWSSGVSLVLGPGSMAVYLEPGFTGTDYVLGAVKPPGAMGVRVMLGWAGSEVHGEVECSLHSPPTRRVSLSALGACAWGKVLR